MSKHPEVRKPKQSVSLLIDEETSTLTSKMDAHYTLGGTARERRYLGEVVEDGVDLRVRWDQLGRPYEEGNRRAGERRKRRRRLLFFFTWFLPKNNFPFVLFSLFPSNNTSFVGPSFGARARHFRFSWVGPWFIVSYWESLANRPISTCDPFERKEFCSKKEKQFEGRLNSLIWKLAQLHYKL